MRSLLNSLIPACRHQFSWPRRDDSGENYQVCIRCGAKYSYDWATMRRVAPLPSEEDEQAAAPPARRKCGTRRAWVPRERRLRHQVPLQFRICGIEGWSEGESENVSRSGLLFRGASTLELGEQLELMLVMPPELTGEQPSHVLCEGQVVRVEEIPANRKNKQVTYKIACSIAQYSFVSSAD